MILKPAPGSRRWQHVTTEVGALAAPVQRQTERNYTIILGSHRNTCLKVEKDGQLCEAVRMSPCCSCSFSPTRTLGAPTFCSAKCRQTWLPLCTYEQLRIAGGMRTRRSAFQDRLHAILDRLSFGPHQGWHGVARAGRLLHMDRPPAHGGYSARGPLGMGQPRAVQEHTGAYLSALRDELLRLHEPLPGCTAAWDKATPDVQVAPLTASQESTKAGLFVVPEATQSGDAGCEVVSLQQLCMDTARQCLQPAVVRSTLQACSQLVPPRIS